MLEIGSDQCEKEVIVVEEFSVRKNNKLKGHKFGFFEKNIDCILKFSLPIIINRLCEYGLGNNLSIKNLL